jgi:hypothetical protein
MRPDIPAANRVMDPGSGVEAWTFTTKESAVPALPHVHVYVPGVSPSELKVALLKVLDAVSDVPEV